MVFVFCLFDGVSRVLPYEFADGPRLHFRLLVQIETFHLLRDLNGGNWEVLISRLLIIIFPSL